MKFLLTGMTAQQANPASHERAANYFGFLRNVLEAGGHTVDWTDPSLHTDLGEYDYVIVGVAPLTSLGANRAYGALSIIQRLWDSDKLTLIIDAPEPHKIDTSLDAMVESPEKLTKPFYSYRKEYDEANEDVTRERLLEGVRWLAGRPWPRTLVPALPWQPPDVMAEWLTRGASTSGRVHVGNLESFVMEHFIPEPSDTAPLTESRWAYEGDRVAVRWLSRQGVTWPTSPIPWSSRHEADREAVEMIRGCSGTLIAPDRHGNTWWNTRFAMSLANGVPVFTDWQQTHGLGPAWTVLPHVYEALTTEQRIVLADSQLDRYLAITPSRDETIHHFESILTGGEE